MAEQEEDKVAPPAVIGRTTMRPAVSTVLRLLVALGLAGGLAWSAATAWQLRQACRAGRTVAALLAADGAHSADDVDSLSLLQAAAPSLLDGDFQAACDLLGPRELTAAEEELARRFLASHGDLRKQFLSVAAEAQPRGGNVVVRTRKALAGALCAAADGNAKCVQACLASAERALDELIPGMPNPAGDSGPQAVARRAQAIAPALSLGRDLMTEAYGPAARLVARASWHYRQQQYEQAAGLLELAGQLLGAPSPSAAAASEAPPWFTSMTEAPLEDVSPAQSRAIVSFCEAVAQSQTLSPVVTVMVRQAQRERDAGRLATARWWASVAIEALGMSDEAAVAAGAAAEPRP